MGAPATNTDDRHGPDPRPRTSTRDGDVVLRGWRCATCALPRAVPASRCPACGGDLDETEFAPAGTVWSSTVVHLEIDDIPQPYGLAYVDVDDGPRILAHTTGPVSPIAVGTRVAVVGTTARGDVCVAPTGDGSAT